jgi:hypothetical protein
VDFHNDGDKHPPPHTTGIILSGVRLSRLATAAIIGVLYQPHIIDDGDCGAVDGMKTGRGNRSTRRRPAPAPLYLSCYWSFIL